MKSHIIGFQLVTLAQIPMPIKIGANFQNKLRPTQGGGNNGGERLCKFPFYWNGKLYDQCIMLDEDDMILPVFRCPIRDSQNKINGINAWTYEDLESQVSYTVVYSIRYSLLKDCTI